MNELQANRYEYLGKYLLHRIYIKFISTLNRYFDRFFKSTSLLNEVLGLFKCFNVNPAINFSECNINDAPKSVALTLLITGANLSMDSVFMNPVVVFNWSSNIKFPDLQLSPNPKETAGRKKDRYQIEVCKRAINREINC